MNLSLAAEDFNMASRARAWVCLALVWAAVALLVGGCTFHFKASEVEASGHSNVTYELESIGIFERGNSGGSS